jgi:hypothetical protein
MDKIDWKRKLSSRKFWAAIVAFVSANAGAFGISEPVVAKVILIVSGIGALAVYMLAEAHADANGSIPLVSPGELAPTELAPGATIPLNSLK